MMSITRRRWPGLLVVVALGVCGAPDRARAFEEVVGGSINVCRQVVDNQAYGCDTHFGSNIDDVFAHMAIRVPKGRTGRITAVWTRNGEVVQRSPYVGAQFSPKGWRTNFRQRILPTMTGRWQVTVLDRNGSEIGHQAFTVGRRLSSPDAAVSVDATISPDAGPPLAVPDPNRDCPVAIPKNMRRLSTRDPKWTLCTPPDDVSHLSADPRCRGSVTLAWPLLARRDGEWSGVSMNGCAGADEHCAVLRPAEAWRAGAPDFGADGDICLSRLLIKALDVSVPLDQTLTCGEGAEFDRSLVRCAEQLFADRNVQDHGLVEVAWRLLRSHGQGRALVELSTVGGQTVTLGHGSERVVGRVLIEAGGTTLFVADIRSRPQLEGMPDPQAFVRALRAHELTTALEPDRAFFRWTLGPSRVERTKAPTLDEDTPVEGIIELFPVDESHESQEYIERIRVPLDLRWARPAVDAGVSDAHPDAAVRNSDPWPVDPDDEFDVLALLAEPRLMKALMAAVALGLVLFLIIRFVRRRRARRAGSSPHVDREPPPDWSQPIVVPSVPPASPGEADSHPLEELSRFIQLLGDSWGGRSDRPADLVRSAHAIIKHPYLQLEASHYELCKSFEQILDEARTQRWRSPSGRARGLLAEWAEVMVNLLGGFDYEIERCQIDGTKFNSARERLLRQWAGEAPPGSVLGDRQEALDLLWSIIDRAAAQLALGHPEPVSPYDLESDTDKAVDPSFRTFDVAPKTYRLLVDDEDGPAPIARITRLALDGSPHRVKRLEKRER